MRGSSLVGGRDMVPTSSCPAGRWVRARDPSSPCHSGRQGTSLGHDPPLSPSSPLSLQGRHGLPGPPGPPGPQGLPGESIERPGKKGDRVSTSDPSPGHPRVPGQSDLAPRCLSLPLVSLLHLLAQAGGGIPLESPSPAPRCSLTPHLSTQGKGTPGPRSATGLSWAPSGGITSAWGTGGVWQCQGAPGAGMMLLSPAGIPRS